MYKIHPIPDKRRRCDPLEAFIFEKIGFWAMEEYNVVGLRAAPKELDCFGAHDVATNGRLRRSHEMSTIVTVLENRVIYQEQEIFERAGSLKNGSLGAPVCSQLVVHPIPDKRRRWDPLEAFIFEKIGFWAMEEYNVVGLRAAPKELDCFGAHDVATNGRLRRSHEMSAIITVCKNKGKLSKCEKPRGG